MGENRAFWRALHSLTHPLSIAAIALLIFNDHWLRHQYPSWLTGKLGDFTWLLFASLIAALLFAWIVPRRIDSHERIVGLLSFGFIGFWFATAKTIPLIHALTTETLYAIVGWRGSLRMDVTDLLTLPALLIGWYIWTRARNTPLNLRPIAYIGLGLGLLGTLASDSYSYLDYGVETICRGENDLYTVVASGSLENMLYLYASSDGGETWSYAGSHEPTLFTDNPDCSTTAPLKTDLDWYRWGVNDAIERSTDEGQTWIVEYPLDVLDQEVRAYYHNLYGRYGFPSDQSAIQDMMVTPLPSEAYFDQKTGNILFTMAWNGILLRTPNGQYDWVTVDNYQLDDLTLNEQVVTMLYFQISLAVTLILLLHTSTVCYIRRNKRWGLIANAVGWLGWIFLTLMTKPTNTLEGSIFGIGLFALSLLVFVAIPWSVGALWDMFRNFRELERPVMIFGIGLAALYLFPFILWAQGTIPRYSTAAVFAIMLVLLAVYGLYRAYAHRLSTAPKPKRKNDEKTKKQVA